MAEVILDVVREIQRDLVKACDFNELFALGNKGGRDSIIMKDSALRLTGNAKKTGQLEKKAAAVLKEYPGQEIVEILISHYTAPQVLKKAVEKGILLINSFDLLNGPLI